MSRYRKVEVRTWGDEKFRALTPIPPCGQGLWLFLITGPHTSSIPGLFRAGRAAMAEELGWSVEAFDEAFGEAFAQGMLKADFKARVMWLPSAIKHNRPESPNVVKSWGREFDLIPECDLKREAFDTLKASIHALGEAFGKAFDEAFEKPSAKSCVKTMPNQEQEQEQEQKIKDNALASSREPAADAAASPSRSRPKRKAEYPKPDAVSAEAWADWLAVRAAKRSGPVTATAWRAVEREAERAGIGVQAAVECCAEAGWQGFNAGWYAQRMGRSQPAKSAASAPEWVTAAGFRSLAEATNEGCTARNAHEYREGVRA